MCRLTPTATPLTKSEILEAWHSRMVPLGFPAVAKMTGQRERQLSSQAEGQHLGGMAAGDGRARTICFLPRRERSWLASRLRFPASTQVIHQDCWKVKI
jgi:hypothetical protein